MMSRSKANGMASAAAIRVMRRRIEGVGVADDAVPGNDGSAGDVCVGCVIADGVDASDAVADAVVIGDAEVPVSGTVPS